MDEIDRLVTAESEAVLALEKAIEVLGEIRRIKSVSKRPGKSKIAAARIEWDADSIALLRKLNGDLRGAAGVDRFEFQQTDGPLVLELAFAEEASGSAEAGQ